MTATKKRSKDAKVDAPEESLADRFKKSMANEPPTGEQEREAYWHDTLFLAMAELRSELTDDDASVRSKAAHKIIDLERTKLRHGKRLDGTGEERSQMSEEKFQAQIQSVSGSGCAGVPASAGPGSSQRSKDMKADAEAEAFGYWVSRVQKLVDDLARKFSFGWGPMSCAEAEGIVRQYMGIKSVTAYEIDGRDLLIVVMNMIGDEKERKEKSTTAQPVCKDGQNTNSGKEIDPAGTSPPLAC